MSTQNKESYLHIRIDDETKKKAQAIANKRKQTLSELIRSAIRRMRPVQEQEDESCK